MSEHVGDVVTTGPVAERPIAETGLRSFDESLPMALLRAREAIMRRFRPILADHDVTEQQWRVLRALDDANGSMTVGQLADRTFLLGPSLSRMLVTLDDRGLITRSVDLGDARRSQVAISRAGRHLVAAIAPHSETVYAEIGAQLGPADLELLYDLLRRTATIGESP
jgi:homoprotocatechuate degradation regulator HpaR